MTARRLDTYRVRNSDGTEEPVCRDCILEEDGSARFEDDDPSVWELKCADDYCAPGRDQGECDPEDDFEDGYYGTLYRKDPQGRPCVWSEDKEVTCMGELRDQQRTLKLTRAWVKVLNNMLRQECQSIEAIPKNHWSRAIVERGCLAMYEHANRQLCELLGLKPCFILNLEGTEATRDEEPVGTRS